MDPYFIERWGGGYFGVKEDHVVVSPERGETAGDLYQLVRSLVEQGVDAPILIRFNGILRDKIRQLYTAFRSAIQKYRYRNTYQLAYPVKANPQKDVVDVLLQSGQEFNLCLEVGSKPELISALSAKCQPHLLLCNGYKDREYVALALIASRLGIRTILVLEQYEELQLILKTAAELRAEVELGVRLKLSAKGTGKWESSSGEDSKFGLSSTQIIACSETLKKEGKGHWLKLLHFHLGSQITTIQSIKKALQEAVRTYTQLAVEHPSLAFFDVGGGLAVDYDGTKSRACSSMNYSIEQYARAIVSSIGKGCLAAGIEDPVILTESGRATVAHHSVLIVEVIDTTLPSIPVAEIASSHELIASLLLYKKELGPKNCREIFYNVLELKERILEEFVHGKMTLKERGYAEHLCHLLFGQIQALFQELGPVGEEGEIVNRLLGEIYFCNFSLFQSLTDAWALGQLFPVAPIHRLNEEPTHSVTLADLTCDSDGKICTFIGSSHTERVIKLHTYTGNPYYLGIFFVGAYQEILGGFHNLFGDTNVIHAELNQKGQWELSRLVEGDTIEEVLHYVQYGKEEGKEQWNALLEQAIQKGKISFAEAAQLKKKLKEALESYTYLLK